jgi:LacI family transcriptional regulator
VSTIKDIARRAEVSTATVSHVINETRFVSPALRERVLTAVAELDYRPNAVARSLRQKKTRTIGLIVPDNSNPFFAEVAKGVEDGGYEAGVSVILCNSDGSFDRELRYLQTLRDKQVDGVIFIATTPGTDHLAIVVEQAIPVVVFYRQVPRLDVDTLVVDNLGGGYVATRHLIELGHERIACVAPASVDSPSALRVAGFRRALEEAGLAVAEHLIYRGDNRFAGGRDGAEHLLAAGKPFTAVFAGNDVMAVGTMRTLRQRGLRVPDNVSVVGFDGIALGDFVTPSLTTVDQPRYGAGRTALRLLLERIDDGYAGPRRDITLETRLVVRESSAPPRRDGGAEVLPSRRLAVPPSRPRRRA